MKPCAIGDQGETASANACGAKEKKRNFCSKFNPFPQFTRLGTTLRERTPTQGENHAVAR
jgi:hypothetical protein